MTSSRFAIAIPAALATLIIVQPAAAQDRSEGGFHPVVGAVGIYKPEFRGSEDYEFQPLPFIGFRYGQGGATLSMDGSDIKLDLIESRRFDAGPVIGYRSGRDDDISNAVVRQLETIDGAVEGGAFAGMNWNVGGGRLAADVTFLADLTDVYGGYNVTLGTSWSAPVTERLSVSVGGDVVWADESYMETYFGVDGPGALASGLAAYQPDAGIESVGLSASLRYQATDQWGVAMFASWDRLLDQAADTPIVAVEGAENQARVGLAVYRVF